MQTHHPLCKPTALPEKPQRVRKASRSDYAINNEENCLIGACSALREALKLAELQQSRHTHICGVSEDDALAVVVADGFGCHGDGDQRPVDFQMDGNQQQPLGEQVDLK